MLTTRLITVTAFCVALIGASQGCSSDAHLETTRAALTGPEGEASVSTVTGQEPYGAWVNTAANGARWVAGFNILTALSVNGFARAPDTPRGVLPPWTRCNFVAGGGFTGCGPMGTSVPMFCLGPPPACPISGNKTQFSWGGDPTIVTTRLADGFVGYVSLASSVGQPTNTDEVVIAMSNDGGASFVTTDWVNPAGPDGCDTGTQDQPHAFVDTSDPMTPPVLWVVWRHSGAGAYGACVRGGFINAATPSISWFDSGHSVANMQHSFGYGIGGVMVNGARNRITVVYSNTDNIFGLTSTPGGTIQCCPQNGSPTQGVAWYSVSSDDFGITWNDSVLIANTDSFASCMVKGTVSNNIRAFSYTREPNGDQYVAVNDTKKTITVYRSTDNAHTWPLIPEQVFGGAVVGSAFFPSLNTDKADRVALHMYWTDSSDTYVTPEFAGATSGSMNAWDPVTSVGASFCTESQVPPGGSCGLFCPNGCPVTYPYLASRNLGDYMGMGAKPRGGRLDLTYLPVWGTYARMMCPAIANSESVSENRVSVD